MFGCACWHAALVKPREPELLNAAIDDFGGALRVEAGCAEGLDNFGPFTSDTFLSIYKTATSGIFAVPPAPSRCRWSSAAS